MPTIEERLRRLEDERAIHDRLYAYGHALDYGLRDDWLDCWCEDAILRWPHATFKSRSAIGRAFDEHSHAPEKYHKHFVAVPRIQLDGDRAHVDSYLTRIDASPNGPFVRSIGRYRDVLVRCDDGGWRFQERLAERESLVPGSPVT